MVKPLIINFKPPQDSGSQSIVFIEDGNEYTALGRKRIWGKPRDIVSTEFAPLDILPGSEYSKLTDSREAILADTDEIFEISQSTIRGNFLRRPITFLIPLNAEDLPPELAVSPFGKLLADLRARERAKTEVIESMRTKAEELNDLLEKVSSGEMTSTVLRTIQEIAKTMRDVTAPQFFAPKKKTDEKKTEE